MKKQVEDWILLEDKELYAAEIIMKGECPLTNIVVFHCQQAIEKCLKSYLMEKDIALAKTHDLIKLNGMTRETNDLGTDENKLISINEVYIESRCPGELGLLPDGMPTDGRTKEFIEYAEEVKAIMLNELKKDDNKTENK